MKRTLTYFIKDNRIYRTTVSVYSCNISINSPVVDFGNKLWLFSAYFIFSLRFRAVLKFARVARFMCEILRILIENKKYNYNSPRRAVYPPPPPLSSGPPHVGDSSRFWNAFVKRSGAQIGICATLKPLYHVLWKKSIKGCISTLNINISIHLNSSSGMCFAHAWVGMFRPMNVTGTRTSEIS